MKTAPTKVTVINKNDGSFFFFRKLSMAKITAIASEKVMRIF